MNTRPFRLVLAPVLLAGALFPVGVRAADTSSWAVDKHQFFTQTNSGPSVFQNPGGPYQFDAQANANAQGLVLSLSVELPNGTSQLATSNAFGVGFGLDNNFTTLAALDVAYPAGQYVLTITTANDGVKVVTNNLPASLYPPAPHVSNFNGSQNINPLADFTLTWDPFANGTANDAIQLQVSDANGNNVFKSSVLNGFANSAVIPGSTLTADQTYSASLQFLKVINIDTTSYPGATGFTDFKMQTFFNLQTAYPPGVFPIATNPAVIQYSDGIAFDGTNYLVEMLTGTNASEVTNVVVQLVSSHGTALGSQTIVGGGVSLRTTVGLAFGNTNYLVVWSDSTVSSGVSMFGQFISRTGAKVGSAFNLLASQGSFGFQTVKAQASDGTNFLIVWQDGNDNNLYGQLVTPAGALSGAAFLISSQQQNSPQVAAKFGKTNYLVVWESGNGNAVQSQTFAEFIAGNGSAGSHFQISQTASTDQQKVGGMAVAFDGTNYLAAWDLETVPENDSANTNWLIYGRLVSQTGTFPGNEVDLLTNQNQVVPDLAFDGADYLLAYGFDSNTTNSDVNLRCQFLDHSANLVGAIFTPFAAQGTNLPYFALNGLLFDGTRFAVAAALGTLNPSGSPASGEVFGAFIPASTTPPTLSASGALVGTQFPLLLTGTPGINYAIQVSTNLAVNNWSVLVTNSPTNGPFSFTDTNATNISRFYRAVKQ